MKERSLLKSFLAILICGLIFYAIGMPCRTLLKISDFTEVSFTASLPFLSTLVFGLPGAIGCAIANMFEEINLGYTPFIFIPGFFLQITYGLFPAAVWKFLRRNDDNKYKLNSVLKVVQLLLVIIVFSGYNATAAFSLIFLNVDKISPALWTNYFFNQLNTTIATAIPLMIFNSLRHQFILKRKNRDNDNVAFSFSLNEKFLLFFVIASILVSIAVAYIIHEFFTYRFQVDPLYLWNFVYYGAAISMNLAVWTSLAFLLYIELTVTKPMEKMSSIGKVFGEESEIEVKINSIVERCKNYVTYTSEVGELARSFKEMSKELDSYVNHLTEAHREQEKNHTELTIATKIQFSALPKLEKFENLDLYAIMSPAKEVGGDFYDFFKIDDTHIALVIADVSGKGVPAALFMMVSKTILQNNLMRGYSPAKALEMTNDKLCANNPLGMFISCFCGVLDLNTGVFQFSNGGHEPPALMRKGDFFSLENVDSGFILGGLPGMTYENYQFQLKPGEILFSYTDGIPEAMNKDKKEFGNERMLAALNSNKFGNMENLCKNVYEAVMKYTGDAPQFDDISMLAFSLTKLETTSKDFEVNKDCLEDVRNFTAEWSACNGFSQKISSKLAICVDEIVSNVVFYSGASQLNIQYRICDGEICTTFTDNGKAFNPLTEAAEPDVSLQAQDRNVGGLGIFMVKNMTREVTYQRHGEQNSITFKMPLA